MLAGSVLVTGAGLAQLLAGLGEETIQVLFERRSVVRRPLGHETLTGGGQHLQAHLGASPGAFQGDAAPTKFVAGLGKTSSLLPDMAVKGGTAGQVTVDDFQWRLHGTAKPPDLGNGKHASIPGEIDFLSRLSTPEAGAYDPGQVAAGRGQELAMSARICMRTTKPLPSTPKATETQSHVLAVLALCLASSKKPAAALELAWIA